MFLFMILIIYWRSSAYVSTEAVSKQIKIETKASKIKFSYAQVLRSCLRKWG